MTDTAERIAKLAERLDPRPAGNATTEECIEHSKRRHARNQQLFIAAPGAQLGALVDLFDFALADKWVIANLGMGDDRTWWCELRHNHLTSYTRVVISPLKQPTPAAALLAAMEEV